MPFRFYVTEMFDGTIKGTNDEQVAKEYAKSEDFFVVDSTKGVWLQIDGLEAPVEEIIKPE